MSAFSIAYGRETEYAAELRIGLAQMTPAFTACICAACNGEGRYEQTYTAGCGRGYYTTMGGCDYCDGTGLRQGGEPAPASVREQVLVAGRAAIAKSVSTT